MLQIQKKRRRSTEKLTRITLKKFYVVLQIGIEILGRKGKFQFRFLESGVIFFSN